jgi:hypothetical protein
MAAASAGAAAAVIVIAVVALPRVVPSVLHLRTNPADHSIAASQHRHSSVPSTPTKPSSASTGHRRLPVLPPPVPANFAATSVTFVGSGTGWVIGQAGIPGHCYNKNPYICTSVARTDNAGQSWYGVPAPSTTAPAGGTGVSQIRFLNTQYGWAFGPELWATRDGGQHWTQIGTGGMRVTSLETVGSEAFAVFARCTGTGPDFAASCTRFFLYTSPAGSNVWAPVPGTAGGFSAAGTASSATIVLTGSQGYFYAPDGTLLSGPVTGTAAWTQVSPTPLRCLPGPVAANGQPSAGQLAAAGGAGADLALACPASSQAAAGAKQLETIYGSTDGGQNWKLSGTLTTVGPATSLAASTGGVLVLSTQQCIDVSADGGASWTQAQFGPASGFRYVGLTSPIQGVAVPADAHLYSVWPGAAASARIAETSAGAARAAVLSVVSGMKSPAASRRSRSRSKSSLS